MVKISFAASLLATTLLVSPAFAQTGTGSGTTAPMGAPVPTAVPLNNASFMTNDQAPGTMWRASKMVGVNIYGPAGQKVGDVSEVLLDHQGNVKAVVIGVGGFLGMGEKDVAVPFSAIQWQQQSRTAAAASSMGTSSGTANPAVTAPRSTEITGTTVSKADPAAFRSYPDHGRIAMTAEQLKAAPGYRLER
ncbi:MAG: PRC-barrel domain-containing protein [Alsobacter sp.]